MKDKLFDASEQVSKVYFNGYAFMAAGKHPDNAVEAAELLIDSGADPKTKDDDWLIHIFYAVESGNVKLVEFLLRKDAAAGSIIVDSG